MHSGSQPLVAYHGPRPTTPAPPAVAGGWPVGLFALSVAGVRNGTRSVSISTTSGIRSLPRLQLRGLRQQRLPPGFANIVTRSPSETLGCGATGQQRRRQRRNRCVSASSSATWPAPAGVAQLRLPRFHRRRTTGASRIRPPAVDGASAQHRKPRPDGPARRRPRQERTSPTLTGRSSPPTGTAPVPPARQAKRPPELPPLGRPVATMPRLTVRFRPQLRPARRAEHTLLKLRLSAGRPRRRRNPAHHRHRCPLLCAPSSAPAPCHFRITAPIRFTTARASAANAGNHAFRHPRMAGLAALAVQCRRHDREQLLTGTSLWRPRIGQFPVDGQPDPAALGQ